MTGIGHLLHINLVPKTSLGLRKTMKNVRNCHVLSIATAALLASDRLPEARLPIGTEFSLYH
jgi:hypothetical protein